jgi:hypothetical protein
LVITRSAQRRVDWPVYSARRLFTGLVVAALSDCEDQGKGHQPEELAGEQAPKGEDARAEDFADAYFFGALFGDKGGEAEEPEAGDN